MGSSSVCVTNPRWLVSNAALFSCSHLVYVLAAPQSHSGGKCSALHLVLGPLLPDAACWWSLLAPGCCRAGCSLSAEPTYISLSQSLQPLQLQVQLAPMVLAAVAVRG